MSEEVLLREEMMRQVIETIFNHNLGEEDLRELLEVVGINADNGFFVQDQIDSLKLMRRSMHEPLYSWWDNENGGEE